MKFIETDITRCNECKGNYKIMLLELGHNQIALCKHCRDKLYEILDDIDVIVLYKRD